MCKSPGASSVVSVLCRRGPYRAGDPSCLRTESSRPVGFDQVKYLVYLKSWKKHHSRVSVSWSHNPFQDTTETLTPKGLI